LSDICNACAILCWIECWIDSRPIIGIRGGEVNNAKNNVAMALISSLLTYIINTVITCNCRRIEASIEMNILGYLFLWDV
jgi:hypothetical protein